MRCTSKSVVTGDPGMDVGLENEDGDEASRNRRPAGRAQEAHPHRARHRLRAPARPAAAAARARPRAPACASRASRAARCRSHRRLPKRGFQNTPFALKLNEVNLGRVQAAIDAGKLDAGATGRCRGAGQGRRAAACQGRRAAARHRRAQGQGRLLGLGCVEIRGRGGGEGRRLGHDPGAEAGGGEEAA